MVDVNTNDPYFIRYTIKLFRGNKMVVTKEFLKSRNVPDTESIKISSEDYINGSTNLKEEQIYNIMFPKVLSTLQQKFKS